MGKCNRVLTIETHNEQQNYRHIEGQK